MDVDNIDQKNEEELLGLLRSLKEITGKSIFVYGSSSKLKLLPVINQEFKLAIGLFSDSKKLDFNNAAFWHFGDAPIPGSSEHSSLIIKIDG